MSQQKWWLQITPRFARTRPGAWLFSHLAHRVDGRILRRTKGGYSLTSILTGLPVVTLTTIGAKSGQPRTLPLLAIPDGENIVLIASNFGRDKNPAWYYNLRAKPEATVAYKGQARTYVAREVSGGEYERCWSQAVSLYPGYEMYRRKAAHRVIPIMVLQPQNLEPKEKDAGE